MREILLTNCERNFVNKSIEEETRLDGRKLLEPRLVEIHFGNSWGCCMVSLGHTRVVAQVSCDIQKPKISRPNEGTVYINVELSQLASQHFESSRQSDMVIMVTRQMEKCFKDSKCIDLESLCIVADKKVWNLRIDINVINYDGNLIDCASIATLAALSHFHRPDVTSTGEEVIIHPSSEKDFLPLTLFHYPICISFITFLSGNTIMDPTYMEERVGVARLTLGVNSYRELCSLHFDYLTKTMVVEDVISIVSNHAANYAVKLVQQIKEMVNKDVQSRYKKENICTFKESIQMNKLTTMNNSYISIKLPKWVKTTVTEVDMRMKVENEKGLIIKHKEGSAELISVFEDSCKQESSGSNIDDSDYFDDQQIDIKLAISKEKERTSSNIEVISLEESD